MNVSIDRLRLLVIKYLKAYDVDDDNEGVKNGVCFQVQQSMDGVMDYLIHNTPLNWLVGPFAPQITEKAGEGAAVQKPSVKH